MKRLRIPVRLVAVTLVAWGTVHPATALAAPIARAQGDITVQDSEAFLGLGVFAQSDAQEKDRVQETTHLTHFTSTLQVQDSGDLGSADSNGSNTTTLTNTGDVLTVDSRGRLDSSATRKNDAPAGKSPVGRGSGDMFVAFQTPAEVPYTLTVTMHTSDTNGAAGGECAYGEVELGSVEDITVAGNTECGEPGSRNVSVTHQGVIPCCGDDFQVQLFTESAVPSGDGQPPRSMSLHADWNVILTLGGCGAPAAPPSGGGRPFRAAGQCVASGDLVFESVAQGEGIGVVGGSGSGPAPLGLTPDTVGGSDPAWSPTGQTIAFARTVNGSSDIWTMTAGGSNLKRLTTDGKDFTPDYSPLGERIVFASDRDGTFDIFVMDADGSHEHRLTSLGSDPAWSPDGSKIAFVRNHQIFTIPAGGGSVTQLTTGPGDPLRPAWSADGTQIAFDSKGDNPDNRDIYVVSANGTNLTRYTDTPHADASPTWDPTPGSEAIAYMRSSLQIVVASGALDHTPEVVTSGFDPDWENSVCAYGTSGDDQLTGGPNRPWLCGGLGDDTLTGGTEEDVLDGGDGADTLNARGGFINQLVGGPGSDDLVWGGSHGDDFDGGGSGGDKVSFNHVAGITRGVTVNLKTGKVTGACTCFIEHGTVEAVTGTRFKDTLVASDVGSSALAGLGGPDTFNACNGNEDQLNGGQQRDTARVEGGDHFNAVEVLHPC